MQRLSDDHGAVAVVVALLFVPLVGFAAIAIDVSAITAQRQQMQTGADAGALAIAQDCARNACGTPTQTAQTLVTANVRGGQVSATVTYPTAGQVTVVDTGLRQNSFAGVLGVKQSTIKVSSTAAWGNPSGGTAVLPLTFSWCEFMAQTGGGLPSGSTPRTIQFTKSSGTTCTGPSRNIVPGGFGWLAVNSGTCNTSSSINDVLSTSTGVSVPTGCSVSNFAALQGQTVLLPIFDQAGDTGSNSWYHIYGYAAFTVTGYNFGGQFSWNPGTCTGNVRCIRGYFTQFVDLSKAFAYSAAAPQFGAAVVSLSK